VPYRPSPDRVPSRPSLPHVSSYPGPCRRPVCLCRVPGRASRTPVVCHVPAQHGAGADATTGGLRTFILMYDCSVLLCLVRRRG